MTLTFVVKDIPAGIVVKDIPTGIVVKDIPTGIVVKDIPAGIVVKDIPTGIESSAIAFVLYTVGIHNIYKYPIKGKSDQFIKLRF